MKLEHDVQFTEWIRPICLPIDSTVRKMDFTAHRLEVVGFGLTETGSTSPVKKRVELDGVNKTDCRTFYASRNVKIYNNQVGCKKFCKFDLSDLF